MAPPALPRFLALIILVGLIPGSRASDWPRFLGPAGTGFSTETNLLERIPTQGVPIAWHRTVGPGYGAPSVRDGQLVLHHREANSEIVESFDGATGTPGWRHANPTAYQDPYGYNNGPRSTPILTDDRVFTFGAEGRLLCLERTTGKQVWERETGTEFEVPPAFFGVGSTPILESGKLLVMVGGQPDSGMVALDPATGKTLWQSVGESNWTGQSMRGWPGEPVIHWQRAEKQASYSSPVPATFHGQRHVLCLMRQGLVSVNPTNGSVHFSFWFRSRLNDSVNVANPIVHDDLILITAAYYKVGSVLLRVRPDGRGVDEVWRGTSMEAHWSTPLLVDGRLYAFSGRNEPDAWLRCVDFMTGKTLWERDERWAPHSTRQPPVFGRGSVIFADGRIIAIGEGGMLGMFRASATACEELGRWQVPMLSHPCWAAPVLSRGRLYLRSDDHLVCLSLSRQ